MLGPDTSHPLSNVKDPGRSSALLQTQVLVGLLPYPSLSAAAMKGAVPTMTLFIGVQPPCCSVK